MFPGISNSFGLGGRKRGVPEVSRWNLDLYDNGIYDSIRDYHKPEVKYEIARAIGFFAWIAY